MAYQTNMSDIMLVIFIVYFHIGRQHRISEVDTFIIAEFQICMFIILCQLTESVARDL